jgi:hypothetical protein
VRAPHRDRVDLVLHPRRRLDDTFASPSCSSRTSTTRAEGGRARGCARRGSATSRGSCDS